MRVFIILPLIIGLAVSIYTPPERQNNQEALTGAFEFNGLPEPQHASDCGDDATQIDVFLFIGYMLNKADSASTAQLLGLKKEVDDYFNSLPEDYTNCLYSEPEFIELCTIYGLTPEDKMEQITDKIYQYALSHFFATKKDIHKGNLLWNKDKNYHDAGYLLADFTKKALVKGEAYIE